MSVQTIYNTVGGKAAVLKAVYDVVIAGDAEPVPVVERATGRAMLAAADGRTCLALYGRMSREIYERVGPLVAVLLTEGAAGDREVRAFIDTIENERAGDNTPDGRFILPSLPLLSGLVDVRGSAARRRRGRVLLVSVSCLVCRLRPSRRSPGCSATGSTCRRRRDRRR